MTYRDTHPTGDAGEEAMTTAVNVRAKLVDLMRRDLIGAHADLDPDLAREGLQDEKPSRWFVGGFIVPVYDGVASAAKDEDADEAAEDAGDDLLGSETLDSSLDGDADEKDGADQPPRDRFLPSSIALTVILPETVREETVRANWGDYKTEPPLPDALLIPEHVAADGEGKPEKPTSLRWVRIPGEATITLDVTRSRSGIALPGSAAPQRPGGGLEIAVHQRPLTHTTPEGTTERLARGHHLPGQPAKARQGALYGRGLRLPGPPRTAMRRGLLAPLQHFHLRVGGVRPPAWQPALSRRPRVCGRAQYVGWLG